MRVASLIGVVSVLAAVSTAGGHATPPTVVRSGAELAQIYECNRCHVGAELPVAPLEKSCVGCHAAIHEGRLDAPPEVLERWRRHIVDLTAVPSLDATHRFRREWVRDFLVHPHDLRPGMSATMPRLPLDTATASALAEWLVPDPTEDKADARWFAWPSRGRRVMERVGCMTCHTMTGLTEAVAPRPVPVPLTPAALALGVMLAPDLRLTRERMREAALVPWLMDPPAVKPGTTMPKLGLTQAEAEDVAAFLMEARLGDAPRVTVPARLPVLERRVGFAEVRERVFHKVCWHCHSEADLALGDGGPGNTGGLGFPARGLSLRDYAAVTAGSFGEDGERRSVFRPLAEGPLAGTPRLLAHMLARQIEEAGGVVEGVRGMPLGLPAFSPEDIQLVESWIVQGRPE